MHDFWRHKGISPICACGHYWNSTHYIGTTRLQHLQIVQSEACFELWYTIIPLRGLLDWMRDEIRDHAGF